MLSYNFEALLLECNFLSWSFAQRIFRILNEFSLVVLIKVSLFKFCKMKRVKNANTRKVTKHHEDKKDQLCKKHLKWNSF